uniref:Uncharacterized protein n=1 Tax=Arundo donax TaxID=35708 RepID=A0A0A8YR57_ARUDO
MSIQDLRFCQNMIYGSIVNHEAESPN